MSSRKRAKGKSRKAKADADEPSSQKEQRQEEAVRQNQQLLSQLMNNLSLQEEKKFVHGHPCLPPGDVCGKIEGEIEVNFRAAIDICQDPRMAYAGITQTIFQGDFLRVLSESAGEEKFKACVLSLGTEYLLKGQSHRESSVIILRNKEFKRCNAVGVANLKGSGKELPRKYTDVVTRRARIKFSMTYLKRLGVFVGGFKPTEIALGTFPLALADSKENLAKELIRDLFAKAKATGSTLPTEAKVIQELESRGIRELVARYIKTSSASDGLSPEDQSKATLALQAVLQSAETDVNGKVDDAIFQCALTAGYSKYFLQGKVADHLEAIKDTKPPAKKTKVFHV